VFSVKNSPVKIEREASLRGKEKQPFKYKGGMACKGKNKKEAW